MVEAGYSGTPLIKKLGIKPGMKILVIHSTENYSQLLGVNISEQYVAQNQIQDIIHLFAETETVFKKGMKTVLSLCKKNTAMIVWVSWYKKSSGILSDLSENMIRDFAVQHNLVNIKVCTVSSEWSGLELVVPLSKR